jgi:hypothetical protein
MEVTSMTALSLPFPSGRGAGTRRFSLLQFLHEFAAGIREGVALANRYETLSNMTDSELAHLGLRREDIPQATVAGRIR